jgi:hypothetical protein
MHKKILAICAALVAFVAMPAVASASPELVENGARVATGTKITAKNSGNVRLTTSIGTLTCTEAHMGGTLVTNSGKLVEGTIESASFTGPGGGKCEGSGFLSSYTVTAEGLHWCVKTTSTVADTFAIRGGGCNEATRPITFTLHGEVISCKYSRSEVTGTYNTKTDPLTLTTGASQTFAGDAGNSGFCPSSGTLDAAFNLTTTNGTNLTMQ